MTSLPLNELLNTSGFQICTVVLCVTCMFYTFVRSRPDKTQSWLFVFCIVDVLITAVCNMTSSIANNYCRISEGAAFIRRFSQYIYMCVHMLLAPFFVTYITYLTGLNYRLSKKLWVLLWLPSVVTFVMSAINPLNNWVYAFDNGVDYHRNSGMTVLYLINLGYYLAGLIMLFFLWKILSTRKKAVMVFFFGFVTLGTLTQFFMYPLFTEIFGQALGLVGIMVTIESEEGLRDSRTRIYNYTALVYDLKMFEKVGRPYNLIVLKIKSPTSLFRLTGAAGIASVADVTVDYLATLIPRKNIYYSGYGTYSIVSENNDPQYNLDFSRRILSRFEQSWHIQEKDLRFGATVDCVRIPEDFSSVEDILTLVASPVPEKEKFENDVCFGDSLRYIVRQSQVEAAIMRGLENRNFEVYYQPVYRTSDLSICGCEALVRLHDKERGEIYPDEFLPLAERSGIIFEIGDFVFDEVCKFLNSGIPTEMGIETISVNMSVTQCVQQGYAERILDLFSKYDIAPEKITFEIVEAAAIADFEALRTFVDTLSAYGFNFNVDNYGIGYSNISLTFSLNVNTVKIEKTLLWEAQKSEVGKIIMDSTVATIKRLGKKIHISGIESKEQIDLATELGVDLLQGFYFSNPVSQNEFISILKATQLARIEEQKALAASEAMSNFLASMSHEIRTPINAVLGMDEMILRECGDGKILEYARNIEGAGRTLLSLINDILDISKLEAGDFEISAGVYEVSSLISDVLNMIQFKADSKGLELKVEVNPEIPHILNGDEIRIRQILLNLMNNAVKYTDKGSVTLKVDYEEINSGAINLKLAVSDTGMGIRDEDKDKLFDKFRRLDIDKNKTVEGSGLGLAITSQLIRNMNGSVDVESVYGEGSTFYVTVPQEVVNREPIGEYRRGNSASKSDQETRNVSFEAPEARILVVDDTKMNLVVARELLKRTKAVIDEAMSGEECLAMLERNIYDMILLDYRMPVMDGIETLGRIRALQDNPNSTIPVIALTANAISGARERFLEEGFDDYITKPVDGLKLEKLLLLYLPDSKIVLKPQGDASVPKEDATADNISEDMADRSKGSETVPREDEEVFEPRINREEGILNCGSEEVFENILQIFVEEIDAKCGVIRQALTDADIKRYTVEVHSLKSSAKIIGAAELADFAAELEKAGDRHDLEKIDKMTDRLLKMYESFKTLGGKQ